MTTLHQTQTTRHPRPLPLQETPAQTTIAYLINQYPQPSHTFIRREIAGLEAQGLTIARFTLRPVKDPLPDPADEAERQRTRAILGAGATRLLKALVRAAATTPKAFAQALKQALHLGRISERGIPTHLIYLAEACVLKNWLKAAKAQHVHAHFGTNATTVALLCRTLGGPPFSFTAHGPEEFDAPRPLALAEKIQYAAFVIAVSEFGRSQLYRWANIADWSKIQVIRCGVDAAYLHHEPTPVPTNPRLVCVGRLSEQKGQLTLIQAAARVRDQAIPFELFLVGDGPMRADLEQAIVQAGLQGQVYLAGTLKGEAVRAEILKARAFVLPSFAEGLPVAIMEALALHRPVISTYVAGIPELVEPQTNGWLVPPGAIEPLAQALIQALQAEPETLQLMGQQGARAVAARHNANTEAAKLANLLEQTLSSQPRVPSLRAERPFSNR